MLVQFDVGICFENGSAVYMDGRGQSSRAVKLYLLVADAGYSSTLCNLGWCFEHGSDVCKDVRKAFNQNNRVADAGIPGIPLLMCAIYD
jgi:TPR repeat protein